jgi:hypothetical protein
MSDHNFEKQIRQKLDELKIPPADTVWSSVETQIRKDKRRRRGLILFPMLLLLIGMGSYFIFENNLSSTNNPGSKYGVNSTSDNTSDRNDKTENVSDNISNSNKNNNNPVASKEPEAKEGLGKAGVIDDEANDVAQRSESKKGYKEEANETKTPPAQPELNRASDNHTIDKAQPSNAESSSIIASIGNASIIKPGTDGERNKTSRDIVRSSKKSDRNPLGGGGSGNIDKKRKEQLKAGDKGQAEQIVPKGQKGKEEATSQPEEIQKPEQIALKDQENISVPDSSLNKTVDADNNPADSSGTDNVVTMNKSADSASSTGGVEKNNTAAKRNKQSSSWKWGLTGSAGISNLNDGSFFDGIVDGIFSGEKALVADVSPNAMNNNNAPSPTAVIYRPSAIEKGFSFSMGAFVQKNLSKRFSIATGLQYRYYSTKIQVGRRVDSTTILINAFGSLNVSQYYRSAPVPVTYEYTNRFHFVELPVTANFQLSNRLPVYWNGGLSLSYLVSTNALHFDSQTGVYYKDNGLFNKLQANLSTSLSVSLWNKSKMPVHVGPQLQYGLTNLMKRDASAAKHLFYFGLNTKVFLKK